MEMLDIVVRYLGSFHDNTILEGSSVRIKYENQILPGIINCVEFSVCCLFVFR
nr:unnamed protein product [Callosobruchus analis]